VRKSRTDTARARGAVAIDDNSERGVVLRLLLHSPKDLVAAMAAAAAVIAIISNALFMQAGRHPSPMFGADAAPAVTSFNANPLPRPRPVEALARPEPKLIDPKIAELAITDPRPMETRPLEPQAAPARVNVAAKPPAANVPRPPAAVPASARDPLGDLITTSRRVASVQRTLTEYGYGQLKPTGTVGSETQAAIQRFERDRKIPVTGQMSDRLVRELAAMTGRPID
jgi:hypothetical protein